MGVILSNWISHCHPFILNSEVVSADQLIPGNDDLFRAVMGGSPGNFGILTHVRIRPLHDKDYPDSRMMKFLTDYTPDSHRAVTAVLAEMTGKTELPQNYNYGVTVISPGQQMEGRTVSSLTYFLK